MYISKIEVKFFKLYRIVELCIYAEDFLILYEITTTWQKKKIPMEINAKIIRKLPMPMSIRFLVSFFFYFYSTFFSIKLFEVTKFYIIYGILMLIFI